MTGKEIIEAIQRLPEDQQNMQYCYPFGNVLCTVDEIEIVKHPQINTRQGHEDAEAVMLFS